MSNFDVALFERQSIQAVIEGMNVVRAYQLREKSIGQASIKKADDTFLTIADRECGEVLRSRIEQDFRGVRSNIEDVGLSADQSDVTIFADPIDGTLPFTVGLPTSTVILGAYNTKTKQVLACTIGEPISGRLWFTREGEAFTAVWNFSETHLDNERPIQVWSGVLSADTVVFLDNPRGFKRSGRQILTNEQVGKLLVLLARYRLLLAGSNGLHQAVLAQGNDKMAGAITSAIGGPQDVCGVRLVLDTGGAARAFQMADNRKLIEMPPQAIEDYDILVAGNSQATVDGLCQTLLSALA